MEYTIKHWIKTPKWYGAMVEDEKGNKYLTSGIMKWKIEHHRQFEIVDAIPDEQYFYDKWNENHPYDSIIKRVTVKCTYADEDMITTRINLTFEEAKQHYLGRWFNIGSVEDNMQQCVNVEMIG